MKNRRACLLFAAFAAMSSVQAEYLKISGSSRDFVIDPETMELGVAYQENKLILSNPTGESFLISDLKTENSNASWNLPDHGLSLSCKVTDDDGFELTVTALKDDVAFTWPDQQLNESDYLILASNSGLFIPVSDPFWREVLIEGNWDTLERMSMPVWGEVRGDYTVSWMTSTPFRNNIEFSERSNDSSLSYSFSHHFASISPEREMTFRVYVDEGNKPVAPAHHYRSWLNETNQIQTLHEKVEEVSKVNRLAGAPHIYLWDSGIFTQHDIPRRKWKSFAQALLKKVEEKDPFSTRLLERMNEEQRNALQELADSEWPLVYLQRVIAEGISNALRSTNLSSKAENEESRVFENAESFWNTHPEFVLPFEAWGNGTSVRMMEKLKEAGLEHLKLCLPGWETAVYRPHVAKVADEYGWLLGTYDSYHSIHDPSIAGTDSSWITAQMTQDLWDNAGVMKKDGSYRTGFKGIGRKTNSFAVQEYYEERISKNLEDVPFNYYFIDCDAYGEVYDDHNPKHRNSKEEDARERTRRLGWLAKEKGLVVGSEGGSVYAINGIHVLEGIFGPYFGWDDPDMKDRESEYFRGRYYPPDEPAVNFKPVPIKERFVKLLYDPTVRIPLFQAAFHDAVITTHHWSNDRFKYPDVKEVVERFELLYMCPPMVHLNLQTFDERLADLKQHLERWSPLHRKLAFSAMTDFRFLSDDHLLQQTVWEDGTVIVVNFSTEDVEYEGETISAGGIHVDEGSE